LFVVIKVGEVVASPRFARTVTVRDGGGRTRRPATDRAATFTRQRQPGRRAAAQTRERPHAALQRGVRPLPERIREITALRADCYLITAFSRKFARGAGAPRMAPGDFR
jgi:hypothetical protein